MPIEIALPSGALDGREAHSGVRRVHDDCTRGMTSAGQAVANADEPGKRAPAGSRDLGQQWEQLGSQHDIRDPCRERVVLDALDDARDFRQNCGGINVRKRAQMLTKGRNQQDSPAACRIANRSSERTRCLTVTKGHAGPVPQAIGERPRRVVPSVPHADLTVEGRCIRGPNLRAAKVGEIGREHTVRVHRRRCGVDSEADVEPAPRKVPRQRCGLPPCGHTSKHRVRGFARVRGGICMPNPSSRPARSELTCERPSLPVRRRSRTSFKSHRGLHDGILPYGPDAASAGDGAQRTNDVSAARRSAKAAISLAAFSTSSSWASSTGECM